MAQAGDQVLTVAGLSLELGSMRLEGPRGYVTLASQPFRVLERLMRRPSILVSTSDLVAAMYPDGEDEPDSAETQLRQIIGRLRSLVVCLVGNQPRGVRIRNEPSIGYAIEAGRPASMERAA